MKSIIIIIMLWYMDGVKKMEINIGSYRILMDLLGDKMAILDL